MSFRKPGWTSFLRHQGPDFLKWIEEENILLRKFDVLATALYSLLKARINTTEAAQAVWRTVPDVLARCNEQDTYEKPGAFDAYAWLHLLERYVRTWLALEKLVKARCIPLAKHGIRALDVGTGPGPSAFAVYDFYSAMTKFSEQTGNLKWRQPAKITCVELSHSTNELRYQLEQSLRKSEKVIIQYDVLPNFGNIMPRQEREALRERLLYEDVYFDEDHGVEESWYSADEINHIVQSLHRYRLITFSNFLTTEDTVNKFRPNLDDIFRDARTGTVILVLGGKGKKYQKIYKKLDCIAEQTGFQRKVVEERISAKDSGLSERIYKEGWRFYKHLQCLAPNENPETRETRKVCQEFKNGKLCFHSSQLRAYRKYRYTM